MAVKYDSIFQSKALQKYPNCDFWSENKCTIWQPWKAAVGKPAAN
jgi:hypothetical protein